MKTLTDVRNYIRAKVAVYRNLTTIVTNERFQQLFGIISDDEQAAVVSLIEKGDYLALQSLVKRLMNSNIQTCSMGQLRRIADCLGIGGYVHMPKSSLLSAITQKYHEHSQTANSRDGRAASQIESLSQGDK